MKTILITGAGRRIGKELAIHFASRRYNVALHYNSSEQNIKDIRACIESNFDVDVNTYQANLLEYKNIDIMYDRIINDFGKIDILINNASVFEEVGFNETTIDNLNSNFGLHLYVPLLLSQKFAEHSKKGVIINMIDAFIASNSVHYFPYLLSKKSLADLTKMLAVEFQNNIRVNGICVGRAKLKNILPNKTNVKKDRKFLPLQDICSIADMIIEQESLNGQLMYMDYGESLQYKNR